MSVGRKFELKKMFRENEKRKEIEEDQCERQRILHDVSSFKEAESRRNQGNL